MEKIVSLKGLDIELEKHLMEDKEVKVLKFIGKISNEIGFELNKKFPDFFSDDNYFLILDLTHLSYINSTGIAIIFSMFFRCKDHNGHLVIGGIHDFVKKVLAIMNLPKGFEIYPSVEEALKTFR